MSASLLLKLLDAQFICPIAHRAEYAELQEPQAQQETDAWLQKIDKRLARLGEDGAFFMAPLKLGAADASRIREDFARYRDVYGAALQMINAIRQSKPDSFSCAPGDYVQLAELEQAVNDNTTLETKLRSMIGMIGGVGVRNTNREVLKRMLEHLRADGYLVLASAQAESYQVTGKIDQLHFVSSFIQEHALVMDQGIDDQAEEPNELLDSAPHD